MMKAMDADCKQQEGGGEGGGQCGLNLLLPVTITPSSSPLLI